MKRILILIICLCPRFLAGQDMLSTLGDMHSVVKGETWESVAASHGVSVLELQSANPDVKRKKLKKGTLLIIPKKPEQVAEPVEEKEKPLPPTIRTAIPSLKVGVLLPFSDKNMVEFYRGLLMAADSIRASGISLDIYAWDCGTTVAQIEPLLSNCNGFDVLFGPPSATQTPLLAEVCKEQGIRLVLPFWNGQPLLDYPLVYNATAPSTILFDAAAKKLMTFYADKNYVIVRSGNPDNRGKALTDVIVQNMAQRKIAPRILELEGDDFAYESAFNQFHDNVIVLDDSSIRSLNILLSHLKDFRQKRPAYRLSLLGYPEWHEETERLLSDFFTFDAHIISPYYYNVLSDRTRHFQRSYEKNFRSPMAATSPRYAALGFDLGHYFLSGISSLGDTFEQMQSSIQQEPYQNWFQFERNTSGAGFGMSFTNSFVLFIHFTPESKIELIR